MTARTPPTKGGVNWTALGVILAFSLAVLNGVIAFYLFNSSIATDVAILKQQVADLREAERDRRRGGGHGRTD